jgi:prepilin-type N-terminal cleavage/methylation domain-containing protein
MMRALHTHGARRGFTLVEALIAATLLAVLLVAVAQTSSRASDAFEEGSAEHALSTATHRAVERLARTLELADGSLLAGAVLTEFGADLVTFRVPIDFAGGAVQWANMRVHAELEPGELDNGADDDGDELVDEYRIVLTEAGGTPDERRTVLLSGVAELLQGELANGADDNGNGLIDERGLSLSVTGNVITIRITAERRDDGGRLLVESAETAVRVWNAGV